MNANELYPIVKPAIILGICGQTGLLTSFIEHAIDTIHTTRRRTRRKLQFKSPMIYFQMPRKSILSGIAVAS